MKIKWVCVLFLVALLGRINLACAENIDVANTIVDALKNKDAVALGALIDTETFSRIVLRGLDVPKQAADGLKLGMTLKVPALARQLTLTVERTGAVVKLMRVSTRAGKQYVLVRLDAVDKGLFEYIEFVIGPSQRIEDWSNMSRVGMVSDVVRFLFSSLLDKETLRRLYTTDDPASMNGLKALQEIGPLMAKGDYAGAYQVLSGMPPAYKKTRDWAMIRVSLATMSNDVLYLEATEHLARNFGKDPAVSGLLIGYYATKADWDSAYKAIENVESRYIEDGLLTAQKAVVLRSAGKYQEAIEMAKRGIQLEPDRKAQYWQLIDTALLIKDAPLVLSTLTAYEEAFGMQFDPEKLAKLGPYQEIAKTPEYAVWAQPRLIKH